MTDLHFLRPLWLWALLPVAALLLSLFRRHSAVSVWSKICDAHLLQAQLVRHGRTQRILEITSLSISLIGMVLALAGPTWSKINVPTYQHWNPHVILLDLSSKMLARDLSPDRLTRAKFKIHDLLALPQAGQFGLMAYSSEPFIVSPLTEDAQTIDILLSSLSPAVLPVDGNRLEQALIESKALFTDTGMNFGDILILTGQVPSPKAVDAAQKLGQEGYTVSVMPLIADKSAQSLFAPLAKAGHGMVLAFTDSNADIQKWLANRKRMARHYQMKEREEVVIWQDQGRWFLLLGLIFLLPVFRRGWFARLGT